MTTITRNEFITSLTDALQYISYYHPPDYIRALTKAYEQEASEAAKDAMAQILVNSRMCAEGHRPICQDTGIVTVFLKIGMGVQWDSNGETPEQMVNQAVRIAYQNPDNPLRASIVSDPAGKRTNTGDNTPAVTHVQLVPGDKLEIIVAAKGGGSENKAKFTVLNPSDDIVQWVLDTVPTMGAGWCPPGVLGIGIGGTAEKAMILAKEAMMEPINIHELRQRGAQTTLEKLRLELFEKVNALGIGAQGLGGLTTVLDVKILDYPTHAASKPIAMIPNCAATRHIHFVLDGTGSAKLDPPKLDDWPQLTWDVSQSQKLNLNGIRREDLAKLKSGDRLLLSGKMLTGRDAAHKRILDLLHKGEPLPAGLNFHNRFIYYVGPVDAVRDEAVGPAGPTTATRMDKFTDEMLEKTGLIGMIGKAERGPKGLEAIRKHQAVYFIATGGAAFLVSKAIRSARIVAFPELGMEAVYEFDVEDMPVTVAVDQRGESIHITGPALWHNKIAGISISQN